MRVALKAVSVVALGLLWTAQAKAQTADEVVEKHLAAIGGRSALAKLTSQVAVGSIVVTSQMGDLPGTVEISRKAPNKARTVITLDLSAVGAGQMVIDQRCDGKTAFASNSLQGDREISGSQLQGMLNASFPSPLMNYKETGATVTLIGTDKVGDRAAVVLQFTPKAGEGARQFFDAETFLLLKSVSTVDVPELGGRLEQTTEMRDYRDVGGVKAPFSVTAVNTAQTVAITLTKIDLNVPIDDAVFARPVR